MIVDAEGNSKKLYRISMSLLVRNIICALPENLPIANTTNFDNFFLNKIVNIINTLLPDILSEIIAPSYSFNKFQIQTLSFINDLLFSSKSTLC